MLLSLSSQCNASVSLSIYLVHVPKFSGVESKGKGAKNEKGHKADAQLEVLNYPVMGVEIRKHGFRDKAPASYKIEQLQGGLRVTATPGISSSPTPNLSCDVGVAKLDHLTSGGKFSNFTQQHRGQIW